MSGLIGGAGSKSGVIGETEIDYEEGIWTPSSLTISGASGSWSLDSAGDYIAYTKIGRVCFIQGAFEVATMTATAGRFNILGLPFTSRSSGVDHENNAIFLIQVTDGNSSNGQTLMAHIGEGSTTLYVQTYNGYTVTNNSAPLLQDGAWIRINGRYNI